MQKLLFLALTLLSILTLTGCKQSIEILEINEADATSVFQLLEEEGEVVPNPS
jgi:type III secretory pathway lipoprotein EscJ